MAISKPKALGLTLYLLSTLTFAIVQSQTFPRVHTLLVQNGLPPGLLPSAAGRYNFTIGLLKVEVNADSCFVTHSNPDGSTSSVLFYERKVSGSLSYAKLENVKGIHFRLFLNYAPVTRIERINDMMEFQPGPPEQNSVVTLPAVQFADIPPCLEGGALGDNRGGAAAS